MQRWRTRFFTIWTGQALSLVGSSVAQFALVWWITLETGSATVLATATLVAMAPTIALTPFAGVIVDRFSRRRIMILADTFIAVVSLWLAYLFWSGAMQVWHVYVVMLARSVGGAFHGPAMSASTTLLVPREHYARVEGLNQIIGGALGVVGPPLGALLLSLLPLHGIMLLDFGTAAFAVAPLLWFAIPQPARSVSVDGGKSGFWTDFREGLRYVVAWRGLVALITLLVILNFLISPAFSLTPILVRMRFAGDAILLGWFNAALSLGVVLGGLILSAWGGFRKKIVTTLLAVIGLGAAMVMTSLTPVSIPLVAVGGFFLAGVTLAIGNGSLRATFRGVVDPAKQGRVGSLMRSLSTAMNPLGLGIAGPVADLMGVAFWFLLGGASLVGGALFGLVLPSLRNIEAEAAERADASASAIDAARDGPDEGSEQPRDA
ncbi:MAG: MFS transporter [Candidatus Bipolaricaulota bacterium]|nr:MAG: MFS transporter [Candidatus Bipolaricaulota bacterium]